MEKFHLLGLTPEELSEYFIERFSEPSYRAEQVLKQFYTLRPEDWESLTTLPKNLRASLAEALAIEAPVLEKKRVSHDGTRKYLFSLNDGAAVESVLIEEGKRLTACFSTQAGCALGCAFCATGRGGFRRSLKAFEMTSQVLAMEREAGRRVTNAVSMGQGEPLLNLEETARAFRLFNDPRCFGLSARRLTLSTSGVAPGILVLSELKLPAKLAVSLHAARQEVRERLMPVARQFPLEELKRSLRFYVDRTKNRVTFEYLLLAGINDSDRDARALLDFSRGLPVFINLIPWNPVPGMAFSPPDENTIRDFARRLTESGLETSVRREKGLDIEAACGQLTQHLI